MALHLTMEKGDKIIIGRNIVIDVRRCGGKVQLSVEAPRDVQIVPVFRDAKMQLKMGVTKSNKHSNMSIGAVAQEIRQ